MLTRKMKKGNIRKLTRVGQRSVSVIIPVQMLRELKWKEKQKVVVKRKGRNIIISDWKK